MTLGGRREPITLRWTEDGGYNEFGEPEDTDAEVSTWAAPIDEVVVGRTVGGLAVTERTGSAKLRIAAGGSVTPEANLVGLTCEWRGIVRQVSEARYAGDRSRFVDLTLSP